MRRIVIVLVFVVIESPRIRDLETKVVEIVVRELQKTTPDKWG